MGEKHRPADTHRVGKVLNDQIRIADIVGYEPLQFLGEFPVVVWQVIFLSRRVSLLHRLAYRQQLPHTLTEQRYLLIARQLYVLYLVLQPPDIRQYLIYSIQQCGNYQSEEHPEIRSFREPRTLVYRDNLLVVHPNAIAIGRPDMQFIVARAQADIVELVSRSVMPLIVESFHSVGIDNILILIVVEGSKRNAEVLLSRFNIQFVRAVEYYSRHVAALRHIHSIERESALGSAYDDTSVGQAQWRNFRKGKPPGEESAHIVHALVLIQVQTTQRSLRNDPHMTRRILLKSQCHVGQKSLTAGEMGESYVIR